ncbi:MBOAT family protein [uncultured Ruthenibacterium sp.]|uniref:MBOAT family O-acyltransferase n=1 Tax=uncultured Ruthenibacterium sp. TaxID=1905347 RepID=UPI00349E91AB
MLFNSWQYMVFLPLVVLLYYCLPHKWRWGLLLLASYYFYMSWNAKLVVLIAASTLSSWVFALLIERSSQKSRRRIFLVLGVGVSLALLLFFKYFNFLSNSLTALLRAFSLPVDDFTIQVMLPVGISFYTFQTLSYVIDVYRGHLAAEKHLGIYALYVSFFPQLVAGPIERASSLLPQFHEQHRPNADNMSWGLRMIVWGLFKKIVVADFCAQYVNLVYNDLATFGPAAYVIATVLFAFQIYGDFSGYSDIALGSARILGFHLMENFRSPYFARSVREFWRRWHISLSSWFMDYIYIPLGGSRVSTGRHLANLFITFLVSGLWHGSKWTFVLWGAAHGLLVIFDVWFLPIRNRWEKRLRKPAAIGTFHFVQTVVCFAVVCFTWSLFRANNMADAITVITHLPLAIFSPVQGFRDALVSMGLQPLVLVRLGISLGAVLLFDWVYYKKGDPLLLLARARAPWRFALGYAAALAVLVCMLTVPEGTAVEFIYFQF